MSELDQALNQIAEVRARLAESTRFRGFAPGVVALTGLLAGAAAAAQVLWPDIFSPSPPAYVLTWLAVGLLSAGLIATEAVGRARHVHGGMAEAMLSGTLHHMLPAIVVGALIAFIFLRSAGDELALLPGLWQMLIALAVFAALSMLPPNAKLVGFWYLASGAFCLASASDQMPSPWLMGIPFLVGQLAMAAILHRANGGQDG